MVMRIHNTGEIRQPNGDNLKSVEQAIHLGRLLTSTASAKEEVTRRLGEARAGFKALTQCWSHAKITRSKKVEIYLACIVSKVLYNLESRWLLQADLHRLNAFHVQCLRQIYKIPCSYESRITNEAVLHATQQAQLSQILPGPQQKLYRDIAALPGNAALRILTCEAGSDEPKQWYCQRRRGRPKLQWAQCVFKNMLQGNNV